MASGSQKLMEDFEQVKKLLKTYPNIQITQTEGDPPEQYDIRYTIKGYKTNPDGTASPDNKHEVRISLPFGYPHFPPTAKPLTPIFHPDIDPDAIRIADFWQENNSLPDLIIHIGQMICGNHYTKEEPFNQSAFDWFEERKSWLPFDILEPGDEEETADAPATARSTAPSPGSETDQAFAPSKDLDILKDDIDFPFDDEEEAAEEDEISFDIEEQADKTGDEISFDINDDDILGDLLGSEDKLSDELAFDIEEPEAEESQDPSSSETGETPAEISDDIFDEEITEELSGFDEEPSEELTFDIEELSEPGESAGESKEIDNLFELEEEAPAQKTGAEKTRETVSEDIETAFEEEAAAPSEESETLAINLDDLAGLDEEEPALDFGIAGEATDPVGNVTADLSGLEEEEPALDFGIDGEATDLGYEATADLSGLEEEVGAEKKEEPEQDAATGAEPGDEEKILSALSLDEDFSSAEKAEDQSTMIRTLIEQKQIFSAKKAFAGVAAPDSLPNRKELELTIADAIGEAEDLYKKADTHEQKGEYEKAGILLDLVANIAADFPGLEMARNRIRESMMGGGKKKPVPESEEKQPESLPGEEEVSEKQDKQKKKARAPMRVRIPARLVVILLVVLLLGGIGAGGMYVYNSDSRNLQHAGTAFKRAEQLVGAKDFKGAQKELAAATGHLEKLIFFQGSGKEALTGRINSVLNSSIYKEGLQGRVLYGDQYVTIETAKAIDRFKTQKEYAEKVLQAGKYEQAIEAYEKSLPYAEKAGFEEERQSITRKIAELRLQSALSEAEQAEAAMNWSTAEKAYAEALELGKDIFSPEKQKDIAARKASAAYRFNLDKALQSVNDSQWLQSIDAFLSAKKILKENPEIFSGNELADIDNQLVQSRLYFSLAEARNAFENKQWEDAIKTYGDAIALLQENTDILGTEADDDIQKIEKTILTTRLAREQDNVRTTRDSNELEKTVGHYGQIVNLIENSPYRDDKTLAQILEDARTKRTDIKNELLISKREQWLKEHYEEIFRDNYPSARQSDLVNPKVRFVKREGNILVFNLSCTERKQGRTFRLELNYQNDLDKDKWSLYSGRIEEE